MPDPYLQDTDFTLYNGDALEVLRGLPAESVHMCVTSPPFFGLRDYQTEGQIGLEETPEQWVAKLVDVFREVRRVLRKDGTLWLEVGDSYASQGGPQVPQTKQHVGSGYDGSNRHLVGLKPKDLIGAPWMLAFALRADGWYLRSDIVWSRPNPMPESVTDRPTKSHSYVFLLTKSARYFFDQEAVREGVSLASDFGRARPDEAMPSSIGAHRARLGNGSVGDPSGRNVRSVWTIATQPYAEAHFATYPEELVRRCILAGTSARGCCPECGAPWEREVEEGELKPVRGEYIGPIEGDYKQDGSAEVVYKAGKAMVRTTEGWSLLRREKTTTGWARSCDCYDRSGPTPVPCTVLDPFGGSGTTALVARKHNRRSVLIELNEDYCKLAAERTRQLSLLGEPA